MKKWLHRIPLILLLLISGPLSMAATDTVNLAHDWRRANRDSSGLAPAVVETRQAVVQVYSASTFGWRGAFAVHTWISIKPEDAMDYTVYQVTGWYAFRGGSALRITQGIPDQNWFGSKPKLLADLRGVKAARAIEGIRTAVAAYPYTDTYRTWPGPNSNTFTAFVARRAPELRLDLPPTTIGKDFLANGAMVGPAPSTTGLQLSLFGLLGLTVAAEEGLEINLLGFGIGIDPAGPALRLPGIGRAGW